SSRRTSSSRRINSRSRASEGGSVTLERVYGRPARSHDGSGGEGDLRHERLLVERAGTDGDRRPFGDLMPGALKIGERLGEDQAVVVLHELDARIGGMQSPQRADVGRRGQGARAARARVGD